MADENFLRTVAFGGYDKNGVEKLLNTLYSQLFERLMLVANNDHNGRLPVPVFCEMDEFANSMTRSVLKRCGT